MREGPGVKRRSHAPVNNREISSSRAHPREKRPLSKGTRRPSSTRRSHFLCQPPTLRSGSCAWHSGSTASLATLSSARSVASGAEHRPAHLVRPPNPQTPHLPHGEREGDGNADIRCPYRCLPMPIRAAFVSANMSPSLASAGLVNPTSPNCNRLRRTTTTVRCIVETVPSCWRRVRSCAVESSTTGGGCVPFVLPEPRVDSDTRSIHSVANSERSVRTYSSATTNPFDDDDDTNAAGGSETSSLAGMDRLDSESAERELHTVESSI